MSTRARTKQELHLEIADLRLRMAEAQDILRAIRDYEVDALVIRAPLGDQVFALETADQAYRQMVEQMREGAATLTLEGVVLFANRQLASLLDISTDQLAGQSFNRCVFPGDWPRVVALLNDPAGGRVGAHVRGPGGARVPASLSASRILVDERPVVLLLVTDLTHERQADRVARLLQLSRRLAVAVDGHQAAEAIVNGALQALDAYAGFVAVSSPAGLRLLHIAGYAAEQKQQVETLVSEVGQPVHDALATRSVVAIETLEERQRRYPRWPAPSSEHVAAALIAAPLLLPGGAAGALHVCFGGARTFEPDDRDYVLAVAQQCAQALERASLYSDLEDRVAARTRELQSANDQLSAEVARRRAVQRQLERSREEERARLARELHDELGSTLTALKMDASRVAHMADLPPGVPEVLAAMLSTLDTGMASMRRVATELRPHLLDDLGLLPALESHFQDFVRRSGVEGQFICRLDELDLSGEAATACFRIFQEALTNIARHAQARRVVVRLELQAGATLLEIADDGQGMHLEDAIRRGHFGLIGMQERADILPASLEITSAPGSGTTVRLHIHPPTAPAA